MNRCFLVSIVVLVSVVEAIPFLHAEPCRTLSQQKLSDVADYLVRLEDSNSAGPLQLVSKEPVGQSCYWKLAYQQGRGGLKTVYLSPDGEFLSDNLLDLRIDPRAERRRSEGAILQSLLVGNPPSAGPERAPVTVVEFVDMECPFCARLNTILEQQVLPKARDKLRLVVRQFPLSMHPWAEAAARAALCAQMQSPPSFWKLQDFIYANQHEITRDNLDAKVEGFLSTEPAMDLATLKRCEELGLTTDMVRDDVALGMRLGVQGTPTLYVNGVPYQGLQTEEQLLGIIERAAKAGSPLEPELDRAGGKKQGAGAVGNREVLDRTATQP